MSQADEELFRPADLLDMEAEDAVLAVIQHAARLRASDLFLLSNEKSVSIAVRRLGSVQQLAVVPRDKGRHMLSFVKAQAGMDISENRRPLDGRWLMEVDGKRLDFRINCVSTLHGVDMTLRMWDHEVGLRKLDELGWDANELNKMVGMLARPSGLLLVTGPTGTGKTTTLYACLEYLSDSERKINTLEDPVEYALEGVRQSHVNPHLGLDFPELLRNVLRQAPDIIMVGEVRDTKTAHIVVRAANSGHLVLATLHAPVAAAAPSNLVALGVNSHFLATGLLGILSQRLLRRLCAKCRMEIDLTGYPTLLEDVRPLLPGGSGNKMYSPGRCDVCHEQGYDELICVCEIMTLNDRLRQMIVDERPMHDLHDAAVQEGMIELRRAALVRIAMGETTTEEMFRQIPFEYFDDNGRG